MKPMAMLLMIFWTVMMVAPEMLAYLMWWFFMFIWLNMLFMWLAFKKKQGFEKEDYVKFGKYKMFS